MYPNVTGLGLEAVLLTSALEDPVIPALHFEKPWNGIPEVKEAEEGSSQYVG